MSAMCLAPNETARLQSLHELNVLDSPHEAEFDALVRAAAAVCEMPVALISLVDADRQWFKAAVGLPGFSETPRDQSFCAHAILDDGVLEVPDTALDSRFTDNPLVTGAMGIRFYAGAPLSLGNGARVGTLCVMDRKPRQLTPVQRAVLSDLAVAAAKSLQGRLATSQHAALLSRLRDSEDRLRRLYDATPAMVHATDMQGLVCEVSARWLETLGYTREEVIGHHISRFYPAQISSTLGRMDSLVASGRLDDFHVPLTTKTGRAMDGLSSVVMEYDAAGQPLRVIAVTQDVTARLQAERALSQERGRMAQVIQGMDAGTWEWNVRTGEVHVNARWAAITGRKLEPAAPLPFQTWLELTHPDDRAQAHALLRAHVAGQTPSYACEYRIQHTDGHWVWVMDRGSVITRTPTGKAEWISGIRMDVSDSVRTREALAAERQRFAHIIDATNIGTWEWNVQTSEVRFNEQWASMMGRQLAQLAPISIKTWLDLAHPEDLAASHQLLTAHFAGANPHYEIEARMLHAEGHWVWVLAQGRVRTWTADGKPEWMFGTHLDLTERKRQQHALQTSERMLKSAGEVAGIGSWELDLQSGVLHWSEGLLRLHGLPPGTKPTPELAMSLCAPETHAVLDAAIQETIAHGKPYDLELQMRGPEGSAIWVRAVGTLQMVEGKPVRLVGAAQNVTRLVEQRHALSQVHERMAMATESGAIGIWELDQASDAIQMDALSCRSYGLPAAPRHMSRAEWLQRVHPDDRADVLRNYRASEQGGLQLDTEFRVVWDDGSVHHLRATGRLVRDAQGRPRTTIGANWDVTRFNNLRAELDKQLELMRVTLRSIGDAVITTDAQGGVRWLNPVAERMTGWPTAEAEGRPLAQVFHIVHDETRQPAPNPITACLQEGKTMGLAHYSVLISRTGQEFGIQDSASPIRNDGGQVLGAVLVFHDVTEQRRLSSEMTYRATHDALTGLVNRAEFEARLRRLLAKAHEEGSEHAMMFIDLDRFKLVNDACGHSAGDLLLQQMSKLFTRATRATDTLARLGGDEFAVLMERCSTEQALRVAQKICDGMEDFCFQHDGQRFRLGTSIGLVPVDNRWSSPAAPLQAADMACYAAKAGGRNRVHVWVDTDQALQTRHGQSNWATRLERALDDGGFVLLAQRIEPLRATTGGLQAEALLRLVDDDGSLIPAAAFLPAAERFHLSGRIDRWVLETCLRHLAQAQRSQRLGGLDFLAINVSGQSIGDRAFHRHAIEALTRAGAAVCRCVCLDITETAAVANLADTSLFIDEVRALGVRVALDDFGAGGSSFGYLKSLSADVMKIDGQFITHMLSNPLNEAAVRCFVDVARVVGLRTVAELVESPEVLVRLRELGVDAAQGHLLHKPEPIARVLGLELELGLDKAPVAAALVHAMNAENTENGVSSAGLAVPA